jgi:hypothetical protein
MHYDRLGAAAQLPDPDPYLPDPDRICRKPKFWTSAQPLSGHEGELRQLTFDADKDS